MDYLPLDESLVILGRSKWGKYEFHERDQVEGLIAAIPEQYKVDIEGVNPEEEERLESESGTDLTPGEISKLSGEARDLLFPSSKAAEIVLDKLHKDCQRDYVMLDGVPEGNCLYEAILMQLSDHKQFSHPTDGHVYSATDFRLQLGNYMAVNYEALFDKLQPYLPCPYHKFALRQLEDGEYGSSCTIRIMHEMLGVSTSKVFQSNFFCRHTKQLYIPPVMLTILCISRTYVSARRNVNDSTPVTV